MKKFTNNVSKFISSFFGIGFIPFMPGTLGSAAGAIIYYFLWQNEFVFYAVLFFVTMIGFCVSGPSEAALGRKDPGPIVIDEAAGVMTAFILVPFNWINALIIFGLFRFMDIVKPYPIRKLERLPGGFGIMLDDIAAGVYVNILFHAGFNLTLYRFA